MADNFGTLTVCATPIGNLKDITLRALEALSDCDYIAAEDTRHSLKLLNHYKIKNRLISYHEHNEKKRADELIALLKEGNNIALVSDAGTPGVSDPGARLIALCHENGIKVTICPGACASVCAAVLSGFNIKSYVHEGFLPKAKKERFTKLEQLKAENRTIIFYESPHKLKQTLGDIHNYFGEREIVVIRELTKIYEDINRLLLSEAVTLYNNIEPKGEYVLVVKGDDESLKAHFWDKLTVKEHVAYYIDAGLTEIDAIKRSAKDRGVAKSVVYGVIKGGKG